MNDEVKLSKSEIIGICEFLKIHHFENSYLLLDYITNLQEENDILNDITESYEETSKEQQEEIEKLQQRIDKTIEYIKETKLIYLTDDKLLELLGADEQ